MHVIASILVLWAFSTAHFSAPEDEVWGFYGHRLINKMAVFTLPPELIPIYKANLSYIQEQAVAPDKRRYASIVEGIRHYIDVDATLGLAAQEKLPDHAELMFQSGSLAFINEQGDTSQVISFADKSEIKEFELLKAAIVFDVNKNKRMIYENGYLLLSSDYSRFKADYQGETIYFIDHFNEHGMLPFHLVDFQRQLSARMKAGDWSSALRISAEMGHYLADAHVPLHTTKNYNGQLTDQIGIHAFWETRIPELFAASNYDFWVGKAAYIEDKPNYFWTIVKESNSLVEKVLDKELALRKDKSLTAYCFDERGNKIIRLECEAYALAYANSMDGMVEERMRKAIKSIGDSWYSAWVDAGRPSFDLDSVSSTNEETEIIETSGRSIRAHEN